MTDTDIELSADRFAVSATEKRDIGQYEDHTAHAKIEGTVEGIDTSDVDAIKDELLPLERMVAAVVRRSAQERVDATVDGDE